VLGGRAGGIKVIEEEIVTRPIRGEARDLRARRLNTQAGEPTIRAPVDRPALADEQIGPVVTVA
jgi:hypothetical protein